MTTSYKMTIEMDLDELTRLLRRRGCGDALAELVADPTSERAGRRFRAALGAASRPPSMPAAHTVRRSSVDRVEVDELDVAVMVQGDRTRPRITEQREVSAHISLASYLQRSRSLCRALGTALGPGEGPRARARLAGALRGELARHDLAGIAADRLPRDAEIAVGGVDGPGPRVCSDARFYEEVAIPGARSIDKLVPITPMVTQARTGRSTAASAPGRRPSRAVAPSVGNLGMASNPNRAVNYGIGGIGP